MTKARQSSLTIKQFTNKSILLAYKLTGKLIAFMIFSPIFWLTHMGGMSSITKTTVYSLFYLGITPDLSIYIFWPLAFLIGTTLSLSYLFLILFSLTYFSFTWDNFTKRKTSHIQKDQNILKQSLKIHNLKRVKQKIIDFLKNSIKPNHHTTYRQAPVLQKGTDRYRILIKTGQLPLTSQNKIAKLEQVEIEIQEAEQSSVELMKKTSAS